MKLALIQLNVTIGALRSNAELLLDAAATASDAGADLAIASELVVTGYPPRDLLLYPGFVSDVEATTRQIVESTTDTLLVFGTVSRVGRRLFNCAVAARQGQIVAVARKHLLPTYDVFDERRYFDPGDQACVVECAGRRVLLSICEDAWASDPTLAGVYSEPLVPAALRSGVDLHVNLSASPFTRNKPVQRLRVFADTAAEFRTPTVMVNQVGGNDELLFDGGSSAWNARGECVARAKSFEPDLLMLESGVLFGEGGASRIETPAGGDAASVYNALVMGTRDYAYKCGFKRAVIGLSGGIDSALVATIAADALGAAQVLGVGMPSEYSSPGSVEDARALGMNLGIGFELVSIEPMVSAFRDALTDPLDRLYPASEQDTTWENVQARARGAIIMAISNRSGALPLTTGNKSELAVGYCTLYGDMAGGLAVISDIPKTLVYELARHVNRDGIRIPIATIEKPPSAELRPDQLDSDSLPPYEVLDPIIAGYVEEHLTADELIGRGFERDTVERVVHLIRGAEYKRRQAAPGLIITRKAFGLGRRLPVAQGYRY